MSKVVFKIGDDVSTDTIYPGRFMATVLPSETIRYAFADHTDFNDSLNNNKVAKDSFIVGGNNFGCGSSREQAASCLKGYELIVAAKSFARIFLQNAVNLGLKLITAPDLEADEGDELEIQGDKLINKTKGLEFSTEALAPTQQAVMDAGGLIPYTRARLLADG